MLLRFSSLVFILIFSYGCSTGPSKEADVVKKKDIVLGKEGRSVKVESSLFALVGCEFLNDVEVKANDSKKLMIKVKNKAASFGGDTLNNLTYGKKNNFIGETIFTDDEIEYAIKADVYKCNKRKKSSYVKR